MQNVRMLVEGSKLTIEVDLSKNFGPSSSGKTTIIASSQGNAKVSSEAEKVAGIPSIDHGIDLGSIFVGLNVFKK